MGPAENLPPRPPPSFSSGLTDPGRICPCPGFPLFDPAPACIPAAQPETHPARPRARGFPPQGENRPKTKRGEAFPVGAGPPSIGAPCRACFFSPFSLLWPCGQGPPSRGAVSPGLLRTPGFERSGTANTALFFISNAPLGAPTLDFALHPVQKLLGFSCPAKARRALPGFSWGAPFCGGRTFECKKSGSFPKSRISLL